MGYAISVVVGLLMAVTGAFGTDSAPLWLRLAYWLTVMMSGALIGSAVTQGVRGWGRLAANRWVEGSVIAVGISLPLTLLVSGATIFAFDIRGFSLFGALYMFGAVLFVSLFMVSINYMLAAQRNAGMAEAVVAQHDTAAPVVELGAAPMAAAATDRVQHGEARFRDRLPLHLRNATLRAVASEDHYLRVYTDAGDALILMRLADALAELEAVAGAQTHRSWWVARGAVMRVERAAGKATLTLAGDIQAPVSRSFLPVLAAQGWR
jgi:hypothetical protein